MTTSHAPATAWSLAFLGTAISHGLQHIVVSPGSRSQALALAAAAYADDSRFDFQLHVAIDERSAGFLGLGLAIETGNPVALLCTSGSAPAHYLPALLEAKHSGIPLLALTADRPEELRGVGANQTTRQVGMFAEAVSWVFDVEAPEADTAGADGLEVALRALHAARYGHPGGRSGPVQVNVSFREPLSSPFTAADLVVEVQPDHPEAPPPERTLDLAPEPGTVVVAGHLAGPEAEQLARDLGAPLFAEVVSGAHFGPHLVVAYRELLRDDEFSASIRRVVTVGRPTLSRELWSLLSRTECEQIVWQRSEPEAVNPTRTATVVDHITVANPVEPGVARSWVGPWVHASREILEQRSAELDAPSPDVELAQSDDMASRSRFARQELEVFRRLVTRRALALAVWEATWPHDRLVVASSRMVRELDQVAPGKNIPVWSSRGLSGIDGTIATARGISLAARGGTTRVLLGDLAFLHDVGSLLLDTGERESSRVHLIVARDGGGTIFDLLEAKQSASPKDFDRVMHTPVSADLESLARAYGWQYLRVTQVGEIPGAMASPQQYLIVEFSIPR